MEFIVPPSKSVKTDKIGLIDADFLKYLVNSKLAKMKDDDIVPRTKYDLLQEQLNNLHQKINCKGMLFCFTGSSQHNYRASLGIDKQYKGTREHDEIPKPNELWKNELIAYVQEREPTLVYKDLEADDLCAMLQDEDTFIYSEDKDLKQVAGKHWNIKQGYFYDILPDEAFRGLMNQMIVGDTVDNIPGLKGSGPVTSIEILTNNKSEDIPCVILQEYIKVSGVIHGIDRFVENWNLLKLRVNRGKYFREKYKLAFDTLLMIKNQ